MGSLQHLLSHTNGGDVTVEMDYDEESDSLTVNRHYDYSNLLAGKELAQQAKDAGRSMKMEGKDFWEVAIIPPHVLDDMIRGGWLDDQERLRKWLRDPDNAKFVFDRNGRKIRL